MSVAAHYFESAFIVVSVGETPTIFKSAIESSKGKKHTTRRWNHFKRKRLDILAETPIDYQSAHYQEDASQLVIDGFLASRNIKMVRLSGTRRV